MSDPKNGLKEGSIRTSIGIARSAAILVYLASASLMAGCASLVRGGLDLLGIEPTETPAPAPTTGKPILRDLARPADGLTSIYEAGPTKHWIFPGVGRPHFVGAELFQPPHPPYPCVVVPRGMGEVITAPIGSLGHDIGELGPIQFGVAGNLIPVEWFRTRERDRLSWAAVVGSAELGTQGKEACGLTVFMYARFNVLGSGARQPPVAVHW